MPLALPPHLSDHSKPFPFPPPPPSNLLSPFTASPHHRQRPLMPPMFTSFMFTGKSLCPPPPQRRNISIHRRRLCLPLLLHLVVATLLVSLFLIRHLLKT